TGWSVAARWRTVRALDASAQHIATAVLRNAEQGILDSALALSSSFDMASVFEPGRDFITFDKARSVIVVHAPPSGAVAAPRNAQLDQRLAKFARAPGGHTVGNLHSDGIRHVGERRIELHGHRRVGRGEISVGAEHERPGAP